MIKNHIQNSILLLFFFSYIHTNAQSTTSQLIADNSDKFIENLTLNKTKKISLTLSKKNTSLLLTTNVKKVNTDETILIGTINNQKLSSFTLSKSNNQIAGNLILQEKNTAYQIFTNSQGKVYIKEVDINTLICISYGENPKENDTDKNSIPSKMTPQLESLPGATGVIYLDFDGELVSGTSWLGGATINAQSANFSDQKITTIWEAISEDFRSFNFNITTRRDLYEAAPKNKRMMCIFTPTKDVRPQAGGVAYLWSFSSYSDNPCWVFNSSIKGAIEGGSHEIGHTLGLLHDGNSNEAYYDGHGEWAPIMGVGYYRPVTQWSNGEYDDANNTEGDLSIIAGSRNGVGYRQDDHRDIITEATPILVSTDGNVSADQNNGFIHKRDDKDVFSFVIETGNVSFNFNPNPEHPNLNIKARILNGLGEEIAVSDPQGLDANIDIELTFGTYFIEIDGVGEGNLSNGYSDYSSIGNYFISGKYTPGDNNQPPIANFEATTNCAVVNFNSTTINNVNSYLWDFGDGNSSTAQNPTHIYANNGAYTVSLTTSNSAGEDTRQQDDFITISIPEQPVGIDQSICRGESTTLTVTGNSEFKWYDAPTGGNLLYTGATFSTSALQSSQVYYVAGAFDNCTTNTRTPINLIVANNPQTPVIVIPDTKNLIADNTYAQYQWYLNEKAITGANAQQYLPNKVGNYHVEVFNETGCSAISEEFSVDLSQLNLSQNTNSFVYYPNPTKDVLSVDGLTINNKDISIANTSGRVLMTFTAEQQLNISKLSSGFYIIIVDNKPIGKFVKI